MNYANMVQKTVFITGCSEGGIGAALAAEFRARGHRVFATARDATKMSMLASKGIETLELDVNSEKSIQAAASTLRASGISQLDILINNAGVNHVHPFADSKIEDLRHLLETNVIAVLAVTQAFLPLLIEAKGVVATVGSVNEIYLPPFQAAYNASKAAVHAINQTLRVELRPFGVRFVTLMTGAVQTELMNKAESVIEPSSPYVPIKDLVEKKEFLNGVSFTTPENYAKEVAGKLLQDSPKHNIWAGPTSTIAWVLSCIGWEGILDGAKYKLNKLHLISPENARKSS